MGGASNNELKELTPSQAAPSPVKYSVRPRITCGGSERFPRAVGVCAGLPRRPRTCQGRSKQQKDWRKCLRKKDVVAKPSHMDKPPRPDVLVEAHLVARLLVI
eukprot:3136314-Amphidinium_carterae.2